MHICWFIQSAVTHSGRKKIKIQTALISFCSMELSMFPRLLWSMITAFAFFGRNKGGGVILRVYCIHVKSMTTNFMLLCRLFVHSTAPPSSSSSPTTSSSSSEMNKTDCLSFVLHSFIRRVCMEYLMQMLFYEKFCLTMEFFSRFPFIALIYNVFLFVPQKLKNPIRTRTA